MKKLTVIMFILVLGVFTGRSWAVEATLSGLEASVTALDRPMVHTDSSLISGVSSALGITFEARLLPNETIKVTVRFNGKTVIVLIKQTAGEHSVKIRGVAAETGQVARMTADESALLKELLNQLMKESITNHPLGAMLLRTLNLLYSWPTGLAVEAIIDRAAFRSSLEGAGENERGSSGNPCDWPPDFGLSASICSLMNTYHSGDSILRGYDTGHDWFDITWLPVIYPTRCFPFSELVGPYPFEDGDCFGRCGKGCIGDGPPNNELNIFTQNCFNHDKCVGVFGYVHPYCNQMFLYAINDFLFGVNCTDDSDEDGILDDGDFSGTPGDNPCTEGATQDCDDNCPKDSNPEQADADGDGIGDACDGDPTGGTDGLFAN